jgi:hypothetical protein
MLALAGKVIVDAAFHGERAKRAGGFHHNPFISMRGMVGTSRPISVNLNTFSESVQFHALQWTLGSFDTRAPRDSWAIRQEVS